VVSVWPNKQNCNSGLIYIKANQTVVHNPISQSMPSCTQTWLSQFFRFVMHVGPNFIVNRTNRRKKKIELISQYWAISPFELFRLISRFSVSEFDRYWQPWEKRYSLISPLSSLSGFENKGIEFIFIQSIPRICKRFIISSGCVLYFTYYVFMFYK